MENSGHVAEKESQNQQPEKTRQKINEVGNIKNEPGTQLARNRRKPAIEKKYGRMIDSFNRKDITLEKDKQESKPDPDKTTTITQKNNTMSVTQKNKPLAQPMVKPDVSVEGVQHPTSTVHQ